MKSEVVELEIDKHLRHGSRLINEPSRLSKDRSPGSFFESPKVCSQILLVVCIRTVSDERKIARDESQGKLIIFSMAVSGMCCK